jgi:hypothetical protein
MNQERPVDDHPDVDDAIERDPVDIEPASARDRDANPWAAAARAAAAGDTATVSATVAPPTEPEPTTAWGFDDDSPLPPRRSRTFTPLTGVLAAALLATGGFALGAKVGRSSAPKATTGASAAAAAFGAARQGGAGAAGAAGGTGTTVAGAAAGAGQGRQGGTGQAGTGAAGGGFGGGTFGTVKLIDGTNVYIQDASGNVVKVSTSADSAITVTKRGTAADLKAGDTVVVQGTADGDGNIAATAITSTNGALGRGGQTGTGQTGAAPGAPTPSTTAAGGSQRPASGPTTTAKR